MTSYTTPLDYIAASMYRRPDCRVKLIDIVRRFRKQLPDDRARAIWPRWRILAEVRKEFVVGLDGDHATTVCGLSSRPSKQWQVGDNGRLQLVTTQK